MKRIKRLSFMALLTVSALLLTGFGRNDQTSLTAAGSSSALKASAGKETVKLTVDDAKKIAFDDAGIKEKDVVLKKAGLTTDDGVVKYEEKDAVLKKAVLTTDDGTDIYEVEFYYKDFEYEYDIDPANGKILQYESEMDD